MNKRLIFLIFALALVTLYLVPRPHKPQIYDCFLFYNELDLLEIRLNEMYAQVDHFVIVESCETFRGNPKPFYYAENQQRFAKYADKIIHIQLTDHFATDNPWERENHQRDQIFQALKQCHAKDIILLSDVDEIVRANSIPNVAHLLKRNQGVVCVQKMYSGYLNRYLSTWHGSVALTYKHARRLSSWTIRHLRKMRAKTFRKAKLSKVVALDNAGWHFSSMGGIEKYIAKIEAFSHAELDKPELKTPEHLNQFIHALTLVPIDDTFPRYVQDNIPHLKAIGLIE